MITPTFTFRIEKELQEKAKEKAERIGIPLSLILQQALKTFISGNKITFTENGLTPEFEDLVLSIEKESSSKQFNSSTDAISFLKS